MKKISPENIRPQNTIQKVALVIFALTVIVPSLALSGFMGFGEDLPLIGFVAIAGLGGSASGYFWQNNTNHRPIGLFTGFLTGICVLYATYFYLLPRDSFYKIEMIIPMTIGVLPAYFIHSWLVQKKDGQV